MADVVGLGEFLDAIQRAQTDLQRDTRPARQTAAGIVAAGRRYAPKATGTLAGAIQQRGATVEFGSGRASYAAPVNKGTDNRPQGGSNPATRFIDRALAEAEDIAEAEYDEAVARALALNNL